MPKMNLSKILTMIDRQRADRYFEAFLDLRGGHELKLGRWQHRQVA